MAKLQEVAGLISESLRMEPADVQTHISGLQGAGRLPKSGDIFEDEAADIICACRCTEPGNATGAYHLPLVGGEWSGRFTTPEDLGLSHDAAILGNVLASFIEGTLRRRVGYVRTVTVSGRGNALRACADLEPSSLRLWFGYDLLPYPISTPKSMGLHVSHSVEGSVLEALADALGIGEPTAEESARLKFLSYAQTANTPPNAAHTLH